jgi:predicted naringenin-chalcone synthase
MGMDIAGIGLALPPHHISQTEAANISSRCCCNGEDQRRRLIDLYRRSGVKRRHSVLLTHSDGPVEQRQSFLRRSVNGSDYGPSTQERMRHYEIHAAPLAIEAVRAALADAQTEAGSVTHLVTVSCTGFSAPGFDLALVRELRLNPNVARTHVGFMGCHGALNGLRVARAFVDADHSARVLLCAVELCSLHHASGWNLERVIANSLFADGAAAVVGQAARSYGSTFWRLVASGSTVIPESDDAMSWRVSNHGFEMTLSRRVPELIRRHIAGWLHGWLEQHGYSIRRIRSWAIHPGGPRILDACRDALELKEDQLDDSRAVLEDCGNMSSPTVLFILDRLRRQHGGLPSVALGFGPGMAVEAALFA